MSRIIYTKSDGTVSILQPILTEINPNTGKAFTILEIAEKDVPDYQSIDQSKLVPLLVKTIQELEARITALEGA